MSSAESTVHAIPTTSSNNNPAGNSNIASNSASPLMKANNPNPPQNNSNLLSPISDKKLCTKFFASFSLDENYNHNNNNNQNYSLPIVRTRSKSPRERKISASQSTDSLSLLPEMNYELIIDIKKGTISGGGLANASHVITCIDGEAIHTTANRTHMGTIVWNEIITKQFATIEPAIPIIISFCVYKKRWTSPGFKLVGNAQIPLSDLTAFIDKGPQEKEFIIGNRKNLTLHGTLQVIMELKQLKRIRHVSIASSEDEPSEVALHLQPITWQMTMKSPFNTLTLLIRKLSAFDNQYFGDNLKLLLLFALGIFLLINYHHWVAFERDVKTFDRHVDRINETLKSQQDALKVANEVLKRSTALLMQSKQDTTI